MSRMWINKKNKKENVNKASCWILAVIFAVVVFGSAGLAAADEEESKEIPVLRIDGNVYDESGANRWYTEEPKVEVCLDGAAKISDKEIRDEEMQGEKIPDKAEKLILKGKRRLLRGERNRLRKMSRHRLTS